MVPARIRGKSRGACPAPDRGGGRPQGVAARRFSDMTAFGKILIFLNLVFALLTGGLIGMVYLTRTNWYTAYQAAVAGATAQKTSYDQLLADEMGQVRAKEDQVKKAEAK